MTAIIVAVFALVLGCSQGGRPPALGEPGIDDDSNGLAFACERALEHLDSLLARSELDPTTTPDRLIEAKELRRSATDLFLDGEYELALEFVDEAISILGKSS